MEIREATTADGAGLVELAGLCPMAGDVSLCVERRPDFFALNRLTGDPWRVGVVDGPAGPIGCIGVARRMVYAGGRPQPAAYVGDLKVHPDHRRRGVARALARWADRAASELAGGLAFGTVLAGNVATERLLATVAAGGPVATVRSYNIPLLLRRRLPRSRFTVRPATAGDLPAMAGLWTRTAVERQLAPVYDAESLSRAIESAPGLELSDYLLALEPDGAVAGFLGLWDQHEVKQTRITGYSPRLAAVRRVVNAAAPLVGAASLPATGEQLHYRTVVNPCAAGPEVLRVLLGHATDRLRREGYPFLSIGLDVRDPLTAALRGLLAQPADVTVLGTLALDDRPVHFEIATV
jgi:GNAT superfamily N-acetyltransferase